MIRGIHGLFYSSDPDATRRFFRDAVKLPKKAAKKTKKAARPPKKKTARR